MVKCLTTMRETRVQSLGQEDPLEKEMATHSSTFAWKIPRMEEPGKLTCNFELQGLINTARKCNRHESLFFLLIKKYNLVLSVFDSELF